ncbi:MULTISPECIES: bifunctional S-methyl-5'-thioadenosine deaminase/S-adenosylhomocysteine deaminase [Bacillus cereus group]|uniref:5-methylthioadenosine/S-adenosylhomocysteine deaminase n=2 Tax=Bacillus cereus group TaxID=86661 RepID=A0ABD7RET9_BACCE|nr:MULTISPECIES: bifunctional S-methyl-5'-thioadenosine deaminase/S-adenosylhomocysteine deaminase [Bacillus cereus group]EEL76984.1 5-methylthioadenosine/S-adenosylhomocysteine deaminase [Bacillus cereus AH676]MCC2366031.1 bifunctional S-methyl-5'-thioadenosine deaminase/S-adenosylhomocysteine deaminase [Bacillus cereus]MCC2452297.1 bifunctional S-methyl-5'-thioadenosine deaminase/S-adenosylhomocysteine deaminase [Bacillus cereus]MCC2486703.1 bifunctional S-methyl-5'-thioadenosine deaminase/S-
MKGEILLKTTYVNATIVTMNEQNEVIENGYIIVENDQIIDVKSGEFANDFKVDEVIDMKGKWVLPGLVNTHTHVVMSLLRGIGDDMLLQPWLETRIWPLESQFTPQIAVASTELGLLEMVKSGTTSFSDMFNPIGVDQDAIMETVSRSGMRAAVSRTLFSFGTKDDEKKAIEEAEKYVKRYYNESGMLTTMVAPHSPYTCSTELLEECARIAVENQTMVHIHLSETEREVRDIEAQYGKRPVEYAASCGLFKRPTVIAHGVVLNDDERAFLAEHDVRVAHNPNSNLKLGSGIANVKAMLEAGIKVGIATDSVASNNNLDMFEEMRIATLLQKGIHQDATALPVETALTLATKGAAEVIGMKQTGSLEAGKCADFITIDPSNKPHLQPADEVLSHLVYAASGKDISDVIINGKRVVWNGECKTLDEERIIFEARRYKRGLQR